MKKIVDTNRISIKKSSLLVGVLSGMILLTIALLLIGYRKHIGGPHTDIIYLILCLYVPGLLFVGFVATTLYEKQKQLKEATASLQSIVDNIDGVVWSAHPKTLRYTFVSKKAFEITSYTPEEWVNISLLTNNSMHPEDRPIVLSKLKEHLNNGTQCELQYRGYSKNSGIKWYRESIDFIKDSTGNILNIIGVIVDITDLRNSKQDLKESLTILQKQNDRLMNFSYIVSHNLRSHVSNIQSLCNLITTTDDHKEKGELLFALENVATILNNTMSGLNEVVSISSNKDIGRQQLKLREEIELIIEILSDQIQSKKATLLNDVECDVAVEYNKPYLESILLNLISNAIKYHTPGVPPWISFKYYKEGSYGVLVIRDNGIGIDLKQNGHKLFGLYKTFTLNPDSKGVGLYITKNQIEAMGGKIEVESEINRGSTFKVYFK